ncbi:hypothetical protein D0C36_19355 [Mucilaginibacter conchicola]|uniref:Uncharacterized protein n=1 Tax=Mucilaginibacter conchicola TaxID=2303333 RepID=A0A372NQ88_9SPHI|nr:hypothetical protein [Mucilaginibacter conchicola]RFZ91101.1 hypothetical protein D0C36_19355 [Mucilaginibacter conchicola]
MKKNIFGILAIAIAISASAFTSPSKTAVKRTVNYKWFLISGNIAPTTPVPTANATYISGADGPDQPTEAQMCPGGTRQCVSGFDPSKVTTSNTLNGAQVSDVHTALRANQ